MQNYAGKRPTRAGGRRYLNGERIVRKTHPRDPRHHLRDYARPWDNRPKNGTYLDSVVPAVSRTRFARFIARALVDAHERGMSDRDIAAATGIGTSTFHRWQRGEFATAPDLSRVRAFCAGLGISTEDALAALGISERRVEPEPAMDPDVRTVARALADPNVPADEKRLIREMLGMIANRHRPRRRRDNPGEEAV